METNEASIFKKSDPVVDNAPAASPSIQQNHLESNLESAKEIFESIFDEIEKIKRSGDPEALREYARNLYEQYFSMSPNIFNGLSLKDHFDVLLKVNRFDELQGPVGQAGVGELVYRLGGFKYEKGVGESEVDLFIVSLLKDKNISEKIEALRQLQTVAVHALAEGDWAYSVHNAIKDFFQRDDAEEPFIILKIKNRFAEGLIREGEDPTMGVLTTIDNQHKSLMFEKNVFDENLNSIINNNFSFNALSRVRISEISRDYLGIFDERNRLISLFPSKNIDIEKIKNNNDTDKLVDIDNYYHSAQYLRGKNHPFNKILNLVFGGILEIKEDTAVISDFAKLLEIKDEELLSYLDNEKLLPKLEENNEEVPSEIKQKSDEFFSILKEPRDYIKVINLEDSLYELFNKRFTERKDKREKIDTLNLTNREDLDFLGITKNNIELFKVLQDPHFTNTIQETFGVNLADLDIRAQVSFLSFFSEAKENDVSHFADLITPFSYEDRKEICTAYLSFEDDADFGYIIEKLCENHEVGLPVIHTVYKLIGSAGGIEDFLLDEFKMQNERKAIASFYKKLIGKARETLLRYNAKLMTLDSMAELEFGSATMAEYANSLDEEEGEIDRGSQGDSIYEKSKQKITEEAKRELLEMDVNQTLFLNAFKSLKEGGFPVSIEEVKSVEWSAVSPRDLTDAEKGVMKKIYAENYAKRPNLQRALLHSFDEAIHDEGEKQRFHVLKHSGVIRGFYRLSETSLHHYNFSAFNVDPTYHGYRLGEAMLAQSLNQEVKDGLVDGDCDREAPVSSFYIENGFVGTKSFQFEEAPALHIVKNDVVADELFSTRNISREEVIASSKIGDITEKNGVLFVAFPASEISSMPFHLLNDISGDGSRFVLTRYLRDKGKGSEVAYAVFQKISTEDFERLMNPVSHEEFQSRE